MTWDGTGGETKMSVSAVRSRHDMVLILNEHALLEHERVLTKIRP